MIERALVHVAGPPGAGKTTLIERLLQSNRSRLLMVARAELDDRLDGVVESVDSDERELARLNEAGASSVVRYRFPESARVADAFFCSDFMCDYSEGVIIEGEWPLDVTPDLRVFVAPATPAQLLHRATGARPSGTTEVMKTLRALMGAAPTDKLSQLEQVVAQRLGGVGNASGERWALAPGYEALATAGAVLINLRSASEREPAEDLLAEVARLREDPEVFDDVIGWRGDRRAITARAADLANRKDAGLKTILNRIKRAFRRQQATRL